MNWLFPGDTRGGANLSQMERAMQSFDWGSTVLGPVEQWPHSLKTTVRILLDCQLPMYLAWGPEHIQFFNDAYSPILGDKAALALGSRARDTWGEIWPTIGPMWESVLQGVPIGADDFRLVINRFGYPEECYFNFSYSPVPDACGRPAGVLVTFAETTKKVLAERRQTFQLRLADTLRDQSCARDLIAAAAQLAGEYFEVDRTGYAQIDMKSQTVLVERDWTSSGYASLAGESRPLDSFGPALIAQLHRGLTLVIHDVASDERASPYAAGYQSIGARSIAAVPLHENGNLTGVFYLHKGSARHWGEQEVALAEDVTRRIADAVGRLRVEAQLRDERNVLELLNDTGTSLNSTLQVDALMQLVTDAATKLAGAEFGAFFYNGRDDSGDALMLYTLSGADRESFARFGHPRPTPVFRPTFVGQGTLRSDDILKDPRYGRMAPHFGMPAGHLPVVSYLAVSVVAKSGEVLGGLFFGHSAPGKFSVRTERLIEGLAAQAARALDNARLYETAHKAAAEREILLGRERLARTEAERLAGAKDEFLAMLAHELRNPLAPVSAAAELLRLERADADQIRRASLVITRQVGHLTHLIDDLMDVSRITRGLVELHREVLDVNTVVASAVEQVKPLIQARQHTFTLRRDPSLVNVFGDRTRLVQVVANLLNNAAKYTPPGGEITLEVIAEQEQVLLHVHDNGTGIDEALLPHVFELFTQGARTLDRGQGGLGIGLALVQTIVALHEGSVHVASAGRGQGSQFTICLPIVQGIPARIDAHGTARATQGLRVLIVDDNVDAAQSLAVLLKAIGYEVAVEFSAEGALAYAAKQTVQAFILDIGLPDISGYDLAVRMRKLAGHERANFIALTGYGQQEDRVRAMNAGFDHHFVKPADVQKLIHALAAKTSETGAHRTS